MKQRAQGNNKESNSGVFLAHSGLFSPGVPPGLGGAAAFSLPRFCLFVLGWLVWPAVPWPQRFAVCWLKTRGRRQTVCDEQCSFAHCRPCFSHPQLFAAGLLPQPNWCWFQTLRCVRWRGPHSPEELWRISEMPDHALLCFISVDFGYGNELFVLPA